MSKGYILLHRKIQNHWIFEEERKFSKFEAWIDILMSCNHDFKKVMIKGKLIEVERGESIRSLETMAQKWGWSKSAVKRFLVILESDNMILLKSETVTTRLTVFNYDSYQSFNSDSETQMTRTRYADDTHAEHTRHARGTKQNTIKTPNTHKTHKTNTIDFSEDFETFWTSTKFPKRQQDTKGDMKKKYISCRKSKLSHSEILLASDIFAEVHRGNEFAIGMRRFLTPETVREYLDDDIQGKIKSSAGPTGNPTVDACKELMAEAMARPDDDTMPF